MPSIPRGYDVAAATSHLQRDRALGAWMRRIGELERDFSKTFDPMDALARAILYQQLSGKAASTIVGRVEVAIASRRIDAKALQRVDDATLRSCGVSFNKIAALRDLAAKSEAGIVPPAAKLARMPDADIIEHLTQVRGIGRWTVEMMLMARLGRPDVLPIHDLGIRKGVQIVRKLEDMPAPLALEELGERWRPFRTLASFYLWQIVEAAVAAKPKPVRRSTD
jgi:DNA-3-methyladenine glycosylase II